MKTTKHLTIALQYLVLCFILVALPLHGQTSQVQYNNDGTSGSLILSALDCSSYYWSYYDWEITVPANTPIKVTTILNYEVYLEVFTSTPTNTLFSRSTPFTLTKTIITTNGKIYVNCENWYRVIADSDVFSITFEVDSTIYSPAENLHIPGNLSVMNDLDIFGNTRIISRLGIGAEARPGTSVYLQNYNKDNTAISLLSNKSSTIFLYGLYSSATNNTGNVYGIYSTVSGVSGKKWAGYFNGGDVEINNGVLRANNDITIGLGNKQFIFHTKAWLQNDPPILILAPKLNSTEWDWNKQIILNHEGSILMSGGKLGVGTTSPTEKLTIAGGHMDTKIRLYSIGNGSNQPANLSLWASEPNLTYYGTGIGYNVNGSPYYGRIDNTRGSSYIRFLPGEIKCMFQTTSGVDVTTLNINEAGRVGIGTEAIPSDYKLAVAGKIIAEEVVVQQQGSWPDFVFKPDYRLRPLHELEQFVHTNSHLPGIPTAAEVEESGLSMGEMQNLLLQKIEELTLYIIEQDKKIKSLEKRLK